MKRISKTNRKRDGAAIVELAFCLPFIVLLAVGAIELSSGLFHQMSFRSAVHEFAIRAAAGETTSDEVQTVAQQVMTQLGIAEFDITIDEVTRTTNFGSVNTNLITHFDIPHTGPATQGLETVPRGTLLRIRLVADRPPTPGLAIVAPYLNNQIASECVFVKEK